ncbi:pilus assembly protein PilN [Pseudomonas oryzihabitans]|nr:pilus assembly protein PilN [Pseudomonas psychrotolerans]
MARINLLPWREQLREERRKQFLVILGGVFALSCGAVFMGDQYLSGEIARQEARNAFIQQNIAQLDVRIKEISELKTRRQQLLARMKIIQDLQGNRPVIGHVFDQLVRTLPDGVYFRELKMQGDTLSITGEAESNNRISELMRKLDASDWFASPTLIEVKSPTSATSDQANTFQLTVKQTQPGAPASTPAPLAQGAKP